MDLEHLRAILTLVSESDVSEVEIEEEDLRIVVRKAPPAQVVQSYQVAPASAPAEASAAAPAAAPPTPSAAAAPAAPSGQEVRAPIVGTFYSSPSPDAPAYVTAGDRVNKGDVLCIIEAMKLMNEIEAETSGIIREILVENATAVEYDQPLFIIEPA